MLKKRLLTSGAGIPILLAAIWFDRPLPWFSLVIAIAGAIAITEFYRLVAPKAPAITYFGLTWALLFIFSPHFDQGLLVPILLASAVILPLAYSLLHPHKDNAFTSWAWTIAGIFYVGWLLSYWVALYNLDVDFGETTLFGLSGGQRWVILAMFGTFATDTAAFFVGRRWGRRKLAPRISPSKTWEGAVAGTAAAVIASLVLAILLRLPLTNITMVFLGLVISVFGQLGDLVESLFKRNMGAKDSGKLLPGHGGLLDRIDSLMFVGVVSYYFAVWVAR